MLTTVEGVRARPDASERELSPGVYRMGVWVVEQEGYTIYQHGGFWGTTAVWVPDLAFSCLLYMHG